MLEIDAIDKIDCTSDSLMLFMSHLGK